MDAGREWQPDQQLEHDQLRKQLRAEGADCAVHADCKCDAAGFGRVGEHHAQRGSGADSGFSVRHFQDGDIDYFAGPAFTFKGRVHTNGSLYLASGSTLALFDKATAFNQIITDRLENNHLTSSGYAGTIYIPNASGGCDVSQPATHCLASTAKDPASWSGGIPPTGGQTGGWVTTSTSTYNGFVSNSVTGVRKLTLPFVGQGVQPIQIIRKPIFGEALGTTLSSSRLYTKAQIRVLLADTQNDLHPERGAIGDGQDINLVAQQTGAFPTGGGFNVGGTIYPFAIADQSKDVNWVKNLHDGASTKWSLFADTAAAGVKSTWLRVEYKNAAGNWVGVTTEWLGWDSPAISNLPLVRERIRCIRTRSSSCRSWQTATETGCTLPEPTAC